MRSVHVHLTMIVERRYRGLIEVRSSTCRTYGDT